MNTLLPVLAAYLVPVNRSLHPKHFMSSIAQLLVAVGTNDRGDIGEASPAAARAASLSASTSEVTSRGMSSRRHWSGFWAPLACPDPAGYKLILQHSSAASIPTKEALGHPSGL